MKFKNYMKNTAQDSKGNQIRVGDKLFFMIPNTNKKKGVVVKRIEGKYITLSFKRDKGKFVDFRFEIDKIKDNLVKRD